MVKRLFGFGAVVGLVGALVSTPPSAAQTDPIDDLTGPIEETVNEAAETVSQTVGNTVDSVESTVGSVSGTVEETASGVVGGAGSATGDGGSLGGTGSDASVSGSDADASSDGTTRAQQRSDRSARGQVSNSRNAGFRNAQMARVAAEAAGNFHSGAAAYIPLLVQLTNDADGDGSYSDAEAAPLPDTDIPLQIELENTGAGNLSILALRDSSPEPMATAAHAACGGLLDLQLQPGQSRTCHFTAKDFAPGQGQRAVLVLEVDVTHTSQPNVTGTVADATLIGTGMGNVLGQVMRRVLASTGAEIMNLIGIAMALSAIGGALLALGRTQVSSELSVPQPSWGSTPASPRVPRGVPTPSRSRLSRSRDRVSSGGGELVGNHPPT